MPDKISVKVLIEEMRQEILAGKEVKAYNGFFKPRGKPKKPDRSNPQRPKKPKKRLLVYKGKKKVRK